VILNTTFSRLRGDILIPASKSHTIRAVAIASLASGTSVLKNPLMSDDAQSSVNAAVEIGAKVELGTDWIIHGTAGIFLNPGKFIHVGNSGTSLRIYTALFSLSGKAITFDGDKSIRQRPMLPLLAALEKLGVRIVNTTEGKCPFTIQGPLKGGRTIVNGVSSQFLTALLLSTPLASEDTEIEVENLNEKPYVEITLDWLRRMNIQFEQQGLNWFRIFGRQKYQSFERVIPADFSTATFPLCAAAITGSEILIRGLDFNDHQGDKEVFAYFEKMGIRFRHTAEGVWVNGGELQGIDIDMNNTPDALPAMAVAGCFARGITRLLNVPQARLKECDRIASTANELRKMGARIDELTDGLIIHQSQLKGTDLHGYDDHRMVMSLSIAGLAAAGVTRVDTAESARVTYPSFIEDLKKLGAHIEIMD
jgi:3-phosphoshikimate 1-carboxyvinyltransferase